MLLPRIIALVLHTQANGATAIQTCVLMVPAHRCNTQTTLCIYTLPFGLQLSGSYTYYRNPQRQRLDGTLYDTERDLTTNSRQTINKWLFAADQSHYLKHGWGLSYGVKAQFSRNDSYQTTLDKQGNELPDA